MTDNAKIICDIVARVMDVTPEDIANTTIIKRNVVEARYFVWYYLRTRIGIAAHEIAEMFNSGRRTIFRGISIITDGRRYSSWYTERCSRIEAMLKEVEMKPQGFSPLTRRVSFSPIYNDSILPKSANGHYRLYLHSRGIVDDKLVYKCGVKVNIPDDRIGILLPITNRKAPVSCVKKCLAILDKHDNEEVSIAIPFRANEYLVCKKKGEPIAHLVIINADQHQFSSE